MLVILAGDLLWSNTAAQSCGPISLLMSPTEGLLWNNELPQSSGGVSHLGGKTQAM